MNREAELYCRDELRHARAAVLKDAEAFLEIIFAIERTGSLAYGQPAGLKKYYRDLKQVAARSPLAEKCPRDTPHCHMSFSALYTLVQRARNEALHLGAFARHLACHAVELALVIEDGLVNGSKRVGDYMVKGPVCAELWQPLSLVRQQMLANAFSFLPLWGEGDGGWRLVSDLAIARYLNEGQRNGERQRRLAQSVATAQQSGLALLEARTVSPETSVHDVLAYASPTPVLVVSSAGHLLGILTPFDLL
jgi:hypothetical protein